MKQLAKISSAKFGIGGYQDAMIGLHLQFSSGCIGVGTNDCAWDCSRIKHDKHCEWTEEERGRNYEQIMRNLSEKLNDAKVSDVADLVGIPVELEFDDESALGGTLTDWRILTEVL